MDNSTEIWKERRHAVSDLKKGQLYINVHTTFYPTGEIRGNYSQVDRFAQTLRALRSPFVERRQQPSEAPRASSLRPPSARISRISPH